MTTKLFQVKNVEENLIKKYRKYCLENKVRQAYPLEKWIAKLVK